MHPEPILTNEDRRIWRRMQRTAITWSRSRMHQRALDRARREIDAMHVRYPTAYIGWSAGKDSTALTHLACVDMGLPIDVMSIKDDLDFPEERAYLERLVASWGGGDINLEVVEPPYSLLAWLKEHPPEPGEDIHGRAAELSRSAFYGLIDTYVERRGCADVYLGLRADESKGRQRNFWSRGHRYTRQGGATICQPLATWKTIDVYAYMMSRGIEFLPVYQCVRMASPDAMSIRKSWWLPGTSGRYGAGVWLRQYYPSLFERMRQALPLHAALLG